MDGRRRIAQRTPPGASGDASSSRRSSIASRLRWSFLITSAVPLLLVGALLIGVLYQVQQRNAFDSQQAVADRIAGNVATFLYDLEQQLLRSARELSPESSQQMLRAQAQRLVNSSPDLRAITIVDTQGRTLASVTNVLLATQDVLPAPLDPRLLGDATSFGRGGRTPISRGADGQLFFSVMLPLRDPESFRIVGALSAEVSTARLRQILRLGVQNQPQAVYLIDSERNVQLKDALSSWRPPADLGALFRSGQTVAEYSGGDGQRVVGARATVAPVSAASWSVVVEQPSREFFTEASRSLWLLAALVAVVSVASVGWALLQSRRLVEPIQALTRGARELAAGRLDHRIAVGPGDELGELAATFNDMAERLQGSLSEIERQNERLRHGLVLARDIQQGLLPAAAPWRAELLSVYGCSMPASEVGGDFYSYLTLPDGRAAVAIGDISGKGVAAALLMALTSSTLESQTQLLDGPAEMLRAVHEALQPRLRSNQMNAGLLIAVFAADARAVTIANAGMIAPLLVPGRQARGRTPALIDVNGLPIGTALFQPYQEVSLQLGDGDTLLLLSDGVVEAHNHAGELFGFERLERSLAALPPTLSVQALVEGILDGVLQFTDGAEPHDDMTLIALRPAALADRPMAQAEETAAPLAALGR